MSQRIRISEIFGPTIQGEGPLIGRPTVFVRTAGCDYRCSWCDTLYAVLPEYRDEWSAMTASEILTRVNGLVGNQPVLISLSGGNPALQPLDDLISLAHQSGHSLAMETQGSLAQPWFAKLDWLILSPKLHLRAWRLIGPRSMDALKQLGPARIAYSKLLFLMKPTMLMGGALHLGIRT
jgi:7-carboxy-7-deazaguanine synthase